MIVSAGESSSGVEYGKDECGVKRWIVFSSFKEQDIFS